MWSSWTGGLHLLEPTTVIKLGPGCLSTGSADIFSLSWLLCVEGGDALVDNPTTSYGPISGLAMVLL